MKRTIANLTLVLATIFPQLAFGQESNPAFWLLMPFFGQIAECSKYGEEMRDKLRVSIKVAEKTSTSLLPPQAWALLSGAVVSKTDQLATPEVKKACDATAELYRSPQFSMKFRQFLALQFISTDALLCIAQQPSTSGRVKSAWAKAFTRNGFELSEDSITNLASVMAPTLSGRNPPPMEDCKQVASYLDSSDFDAQYSEEGVLKLFEGRK